MKGHGMSDVDEAKRVLADAGFTVLRTKSYRQAQERQRCAEVRGDCAERYRADTDRWVRSELLPEIRHLRDRCAFLYGAARSYGATVEELRGDPS